MLEHEAENTRNNYIIARRPYSTIIIADHSQYTPKDRNSMDAFILIEFAQKRRKLRSKKKVIEFFWVNFFKCLPQIFQFKTLESASSPASKSHFWTLVTKQLIKKNKPKSIQVPNKTDLYCLAILSIYPKITRILLGSHRQHYYVNRGGQMKKHLTWRQLPFSITNIQKSCLIYTVKASALIAYMQIAEKLIERWTWLLVAQCHINRFWHNEYLHYF